MERTNDNAEMELRLFMPILPIILLSIPRLAIFSPRVHNFDNIYRYSKTTTAT